MCKIALLCFDNPYLQPIEGGKRSMLSRIQALGLLDVSVDLYLLCKPNEGAVPSFEGLVPDNVENVFQYRMRDAGLAMLFSKCPICSEKRFVDEMVMELSHRDYDVAIYEGEHMMRYRLDRVVKAQRHVIYFHNIESEYRGDIARSERSALKRLAQKNESRKFLHFEQGMGGLFDAGMFISFDEMMKVGSLVPNSIYAPYATACISDFTTGADSGTLLYVGDLSLDNNYQSLLWFCEEVLPLIVKKNSEVCVSVVGRLSEDGKRQLFETSCGNSLSIKGYVDDLDAEYANAALVLCPVLYGAGVKVKVIDAIGKGQIVVATEKAIEGTRLVPGKHLLTGDSAKDFAQACCDVLANRQSCESIAAEGLRFVREEHSIENHAKVLWKAISNA